MLIKILDVKTEYVKTARGGYNKAQVSYDAGNGVKMHNIMDFSNKQVFNTAVAAKSGDNFDVVVRKNDKGYDEWASLVASTSAPTASAPTTPSKAPTSNYETREERALRQRLIVRQSSLSAAIATLSPGAKSALDPHDIIKLAEQYTAWVFEPPSLFDEPSDNLDDIPL